MRNHPDKASVAQYLDWNSSDGETAKSPYFAIYVGVDWRARPLLRAYRFLPHSLGVAVPTPCSIRLRPARTNVGAMWAARRRQERHRLSTRIKHGQN
jgi:hypothetical protein